MKFMKRKGVYQASNYNVTFDPKTCSAFSYSWWKFVGIVEGKVVFNNFRYSNTTSKHQSKVRSLLKDLGIKIDIEMPLPKGLPGSYRRGLGMEFGQVTPEGTTLNDLIKMSEEYLCDKIGEDILKQQDRSEKAKSRRLKQKLEDYLENVVHFRDYEIRSKTEFGKYNKIAVHQIVDDVETDVETALYNFSRDGFGNVVFYA